MNLIEFDFEQWDKDREQIVYIRKGYEVEYFHFFDYHLDVINNEDRIFAGIIPEEAELSFAGRIYIYQWTRLGFLNNKDYKGNQFKTDFDLMLASSDISKAWNDDI